MPPPAESPHSPVSSRHRRVGELTLAAIVAGMAVATALSHPGFGWFSSNLLFFGFPALAIVVGFRELARLGVARAFGFRVFGVRWGAGPELFRVRYRNVHHRFAPIPLGADARIAASRPAYHRLACYCLTLAPPLAQIFVALLLRRFEDPWLSSMGDGFAPYSVFQLSNLVLLAIHVLIPFELPSGLRSDLRRWIELATSGIEEKRARRAVAFAMRIEWLLESGRLERACRELDRAIHQLGREPTLVRLEERIRRISNATDSCKSAIESAITDPFAQPRTSWGLDLARPPFPVRLARRLLGFAPIAIASILFACFRVEALVSTAHDAWVVEAERVALHGSPGRCQDQLEKLDQRLRFVASLTALPRELQIQELRARAALHACSRDFDRAARDQALAVQIADTLRQTGKNGQRLDSRENIEAELVHSAELRQLAAWHAARGAYRDALRATAKAVREIAIAVHAADSWPPTPRRSWALELFERERQLLAITQNRIIEAMGV